MTREEIELTIDYLKNIQKEYTIVGENDGYTYPLPEWYALDDAIKVLEQEPCTLDDAREDFVFDVYNILDFLPTNDEANRIIEVFDRVTSDIRQEPILDKIRAELHSTAEMHEDGVYYLRDEWIDEYFDKYKAESEEL